MQLCYAFDPEQFYLGTLCVHGHRWPGTDQSLRARYVSPSGVRVDRCMGCCGRKQSDWLVRFIDHKASGLPSARKLGKLCPAGHDYKGTGLTLRFMCGHCVECEKERGKTEHQREIKRKSYLRCYERDPEKYQERNRKRWLKAGSDERQQRIEYKRQARHRLRQQGLTTRGTAPIVRVLSFVERIERDAELLRRRTQRQAEAAARRAERETPEWQEQQRQKRLARYQSDPTLRLYHREKSKRRKALIKERHAIQVRAKDIRARFAEFDGCAYCGSHGDMHMDHFIPLALGGTHTLDNLIPACPRCNYSKRDNDPETWYKEQPFFSEKRWRKILAVLGKKRGPATQLTLL